MLSGCYTSVLVHLGCYNKVPQAGWLISNKHLFPTVLEAGQSKIREPADSAVAGDAHSLLPRQCLK